MVRMAADARVLPQLRTLRHVRLQTRAQSRDSRGVATTTDTQTRMTARAYVLL